jgi:outer membrane immunogenic protein
MKKFALAACVLAFSTIGALAADMAPQIYTKAPPTVSPTYNWTGWYVGANVGYGWEDPTVTFTPTEVISASNIGTTGTSFNTKGAVGGVQFGYNHQFDQHWLAGIETDFSGSGIKGQGATVFVAFPGTLNFPFTANASEEVKWFGTVRGRVGFLMTPDILVFGTGGFAYGQVDHSASIFNPTGSSPGGTTTFTVTCNPNANCYAGSSSRIATGWTAGGGLEYAVAHNWTVKAEYLYVNLGRDAFAASATSIIGTGNSQLIAAFSDTHFNLVRVGANYKF